MSTRRPRSTFLGWLAVLVWAGALLPGALHAQPVHETPLVLKHAHMVVSSGRPVTATPSDIELPLHWDVAFKGRPGRADVRLDFMLPPEAKALREPHALFIARLGSAYEIELNGVLLSSAGSLVGPSDQWRAKQPVVVTFASRLLAERNELRISIRADAGYRAGLSQVVFGPARLIAPIAQQAELLRVSIPESSVALSLLVACFCALLWWQQRDILYAWAGLGGLLWAVVVADAVLEFAPLPWPYWGFSVVMLRAAWVWSLYATAQEVSGRWSRAENWALVSIQASVPLWVVLSFVLRTNVPMFVWYAVAVGASAWVNFRLIRQAWHQPTSERLMILLATLSVLTASLRDVYAGRFDASLYDETVWSTYVSFVVGTAMMWIVSQRFLRARAEVMQLNASLAQRVELKEHELRVSFDRLSEVESSRAVLAERERILRDMHDGVGSSLAAAVRQLESGKAPVDQVVQTLRESMDHLKLSIDAMNLPAGDVNALLASLRYRLQPRVEGAGLQVVWNVDPLPLWAAASDEAMRHLQFLLLEVISNVLQHAQASTLTLAATFVHGDIGITLSDDGCGVFGAKGRGLQSLQKRADAIGAELSIATALPGTRVSIKLRAGPLRGQPADCPVGA